MINGRTIAAERERPISESERMMERKRMRRRRVVRVLMGLLTLALLAWLIINGVINLAEVLKRRADEEAARQQAEPGYTLTADIVDEVGAGVTESHRVFVAQIEADLAEYGYRLLRAVLPMGKTRQMNLYISGVDGYIKVRSDRGSGVQAEDIDRMLRYIGERGIKVAEYVDVRTEGKGYYK